MQFDFTLPGNGNQHLDVAGTFLKYTSGTGKIRVRLNGGGFIDLMPGQGVGNVKFNNVDLQDRTGFANSGTILAGNYDFRDDNVYGTVTVRDSSSDIVQANKSFIGAGPVYGSGGTTMTALFVYNPSGSGRIVKIKGARYCIAAGGTTMPPNGFALRIGAFAPTVTNKAVSKLAGGAQSLTICQSQVINQGDLNALAGPYSYVPTATMGELAFKDPFVIPPGMVFAIVGGQPTDTQLVTWNVEFTEE
jgi:hypothetical protein